ncbi:lipoprotein [Aquihabitans daechungensis]|uniref:LptM family lipoprotein n=1 Tax=Aquihabitans daechungensis TaxID=1052257 RepID=UPI003B9DDC57
MRKTLSIVAAVAALSFLGACGASGGSDDAKADDPTTTAAPEEETTTTTTEAESDAVEVADWAESFCGSFSTWLEEIQTASGGVTENVTPGDIDSAKTAIADLFGSASEATQTLISDLEDAGDPDIDDGDELVDDLIEKFEAFDAAALEAKTDTESLATDDIATFQAEADELTTRFQDEVNTVADSFSEIDTKYPSEELNTELNSACDF